MMNRNISVLMSIAFLATANSSAIADRPEPSRVRTLDLNVRDIVTTQIGRDHRWRGITRVDAYERWSLTIDKIAQGLRRGNPPRLLQQIDIQWLSVENGRSRSSLIPIDATVQSIELERWNGRSLRFVLRRKNGDLRCRSSQNSNQRWQATCSRTNPPANHGTNPDYTHPTDPFRPPPLPRPQNTLYNWSGETAVIRACGTAFSGNTNEIACLDALISVAYNPTKMIATCDSAMSGNTNGLTCVRFAAKSMWDPSRTIAACERAMSGDTNKLACMKTIANTSYDSSRSIAACERAMSGNTNTLTCIRIASKSFRDISETIRACDESMNGDSAKLSCIKRATR